VVENRASWMLSSPQSVFKNRVWLRAIKRGFENLRFGIINNLKTVKVQILRF